MDMAELAKANAITLEAKKDGLNQRQSGDWTLRLTIASADMDERITKAAMGTRYAVVLVEVSDDETPVDHAATSRDEWRKLGPVKQAGIRCTDPIFWAYLREEKMFPVYDEEQCAVAVREICGVLSRTELNNPLKSEERLRWHELDNAFRAWKVRENA